MRLWLNNAQPIEGKQIMKKSKPEGRLAKRMAFYALNRRKAQGRSVLRQLRAAIPAKAEQQAVDSLYRVRR